MERQQFLEQIARVKDAIKLARQAECPAQHLAQALETICYIESSLRLDRGDRENLDREPESALEPAIEFSESPAGDRGRERWARRYEELNGAPEGDWDR